MSKKNIEGALNKKLKSRAGESIAETLVALLVSSLALVMLAGAITAATRIVTASRAKLKQYYTVNEYMVGTVSSDGLGSDISDIYGSGSKTITISNDTIGVTEKYTYSVGTYINKVFKDKTVISYKK